MSVSPHHTEGRIAACLNLSLSEAVWKWLSIPSGEGYGLILPHTDLFCFISSPGTGKAVGLVWLDIMVCLSEPFMRSS